MGRGDPMASRADQRGLAGGAAHLRRIRRGSRAHAHGATMTVSTGTRVPVEETRIALGRPLRVRASPFEFERFGTASEMVESLRALRAGNGDAVLRDALIENGARSLATTTATLALAIDVTERSTSLVLARPDGRVEAAHFVPLGLGMGADHAVVRASLDNVRRWLPWPIDAPALLERVWSRGRRPQGPATAEATVLLEMALAREAIAHALRDTAEAGLDVGAMRSAPSILITR